MYAESEQAGAFFLLGPSVPAEACGPEVFERYFLDREPVQFGGRRISEEEFEKSMDFI